MCIESVTQKNYLDADNARERLINARREAESGLQRDAEQRTK